MGYLRLMLRGFYFLFLCLGIGGFVAFAQDGSPPPPPPPLIYSAPQVSDIKEFVSKDAGFSASFPGIPDSKVLQGEGFVLTYFKTRRKGSNSTVTLIEYKEHIESKAEKIIEKYRESILNNPLVIGKSQYPSRITSDRETNVDGIKVREIDYTSDLEFTKIRLLFIANRVYELKTDVTNWHLLNQYHKEIVADFEKETARFFNSFKIIK